MKKLIALGMSAILVLSLCACSFSFTTANFQNLAMASEINEETMKPVEKTSTFSPLTPMIYLTGSLNNAPDDTVIKAKWIYFGEDPAVEIDSATYTAEESDTNFQFNLSMPDNGWLVGEYRVKLYINDKIEKSVKFEVLLDGETSAAPSTVVATTAADATLPSAAYFQELMTCEGVDPNNYKPLTITETFAPTTPEIYVTGSLMNAKAGDEITVYWQYTEGFTPVDLYNSTLDIEHVDTDFYFGLEMPDGGWDTGAYEIQFYLNGTNMQTVGFNVA